MEVKFIGPRAQDIDRDDPAKHFYPSPLCDRQFCTEYCRDRRLHRQFIQMIPRCPACAEPYGIEVDGSNVKNVTPGQTSIAKCEKCGREFKYILFRSYFQDTPDIPIFNGFTIKEEIK